jgi:hypothetical protein
MVKNTKEENKFTLFYFRRGIKAETNQIFCFLQIHLKLITLQRDEILFLVDKGRVPKTNGIGE